MNFPILQKIKRQQDDTENALVFTTGNGVTVEWDAPNETPRRQTEVRLKQPRNRTNITFHKHGHVSARFRPQARYRFPAFSSCNSFLFLFLACAPVHLQFSSRPRVLLVRHFVSSPDPPLSEESRFQSLMIPR